MVTSEQIDEIANQIKNWKLDDKSGSSHEYVGYVGDSKRYRLVCASFEIESQGFPKGARGYDGAMIDLKVGLFQRLTREQAEKVFMIAAKHSDN